MRSSYRQIRDDASRAWCLQPLGASTRFGGEQADLAAAESRLFRDRTGFNVSADLRFSEVTADPPGPGLGPRWFHFRVVNAVARLRSQVGKDLCTAADSFALQARFFHHADGRSIRDRAIGPHPAQPGLEIRPVDEMGESFRRVPAAPITGAENVAEHRLRLIDENADRANGCIGAADAKKIGVVALALVPRLGSSA